MANSDDHEPVDPRAKWRKLPPEPVPTVEETHVEGSSSDYSTPNVDPGQDFTRLYGG
ncbi:hypothetical protein JK358_15785 [Nocardia sp. 2]|uniref:Uncharacterized protein n=1 Tax=Nocardia acididurans TaxID=2802282 RepID=A0ABS1M5B9_9NOCA|nr:hypothetical protein [Nocardia acididurans]MBL1075857.1 hypothetical protein [Nocardia acididurans]